MLNGNIAGEHNLYNLRMDRNIVGPRVRLGRSLLSPPLTQNELAVRLQLQGLGLAQPAISKVELGRRPVLDLEVVCLARTLGVSCAWLLGETDSPGRSVGGKR